MPQWAWVLIVIAGLLVFGWVVDERSRRRRGVVGRKARRLAWGDRHRIDGEAMGRSARNVADADQVDPGIVTRASYRHQDPGGGGSFGGPVG